MKRIARLVTAMLSSPEGASIAESASLAMFAVVGFPPLVPRMPNPEPTEAECVRDIGRLPGAVPGRPA